MASWYNVINLIVLSMRCACTRELPAPCKSLMSFLWAEQIYNHRQQQQHCFYLVIEMGRNRQKHKKKTLDMLDFSLRFFFVTRKKRRYCTYILWTYTSCGRDCDCNLTKATTRLLLTYLLKTQWRDFFLSELCSKYFFPAGEQGLLS